MAIFSRSKNPHYFLIKKGILKKKDLDLSNTNKSA